MNGTAETLATWMRRLTLLTAALWLVAVFLPDQGLGQLSFVLGVLAGFGCYALLSERARPSWAKTVFGMMAVGLVGIAGLGEAIELRREAPRLSTILTWVQMLWLAVLFFTAPVLTASARKARRLSAPRPGPQQVGPDASQLSGAKLATGSPTASPRVQEKVPPGHQPGVGAQPRQRIDQPSQLGSQTGFEPSALAATNYVRGAFHYGTPQGHALDFAKALSRAGLIDRFATFWEPVAGGAGSAGEIITVVLTGKRLHIVELRREPQGDVTWTVDEGTLIAIDNPTGSFVGEARSLLSAKRKVTESRVSTAVRESRAHVPVSSSIVLLPTDQGLGHVVQGDWNGATGFGLTDFLSLLAGESSFDPGAKGSPELIANLRNLATAGS